MSAAQAPHEMAPHEMATRETASERKSSGSQAPASPGATLSLAPLALVTRPEPSGGRLAEQLQAAGWRTLPAPLMRFEALEAVADPAGAWGVALTSASGARAAPRAAGFADVRASDGDAAALAALISGHAPAGAEVVHLCGRHGGDALADALAAAGIRARQVVVYAMAAADALPPEADAALAAGQVKMIPVFSPRSGGILARLLGPGHDLRRTVAVAISLAAAEGLSDLGFARVRVAGAPTRKAMRAAMGEVARSARRAPRAAPQDKAAAADDAGREP